MRTLMEQGAAAAFRQAEQDAKSQLSVSAAKRAEALAKVIAHEKQPVANPLSAINPAYVAPMQNHQFQQQKYQVQQRTQELQQPQQVTKQAAKLTKQHDTQTIQQVKKIQKRMNAKVHAMQQRLAAARQRLHNQEVESAKVKKELMVQAKAA